MTYPESVRYLYSLGNELKTAKFDLERITVILEALGSPHRQGRFVHVAGTNGKGSTCALMEAGLRNAGVRTGLYTSPHLHQPTERMRIAGEPVSEERFAAIFTQVHECAEHLLAAGSLDFHPTYFETVTAMAFQLFAEEAEFTVLETGLGGRLDATNVVNPELCVITPIDFDHENFLGNTIESIAGEKAGILKPGVPAVFAAQRPEASAVLERHTPFERSSDWPVEVPEIDKWGSRFRLRGEPVVCPLAGRHQVENARTAAVALQRLGYAPRFENARWPGRLERVSTSPDVILDGAHNPAGARALAAYVQEFFAGEPLRLVFGAMRDKAVGEMAELLFPLFDEVVVTRPDQTRAIAPEVLVRMSDHENIRATETLGEALALPFPGTSFVTGSLFLVGEAGLLLSKS